MNKIIHISSSLSAHPIELSASLIYNSYNRSIDIVDTLNNIIS